MNLELTEKERELLELLVSRRLNEIGPEIHHTDKRAYRGALKEDDRVLEGLRDRLAALKA